MLAWALALTTAFLVAEVIGAFVFNSLALLSDAAHTFTDAAGLAIALAAVKIGQRPSDDKRTVDSPASKFSPSRSTRCSCSRSPDIYCGKGSHASMFPPRWLAGYAHCRRVRSGREPLSDAPPIGRPGGSLSVKGAYLEVWTDIRGSRLV